MTLIERKCGQTLRNVYYQALSQVQMGRWASSDGTFVDFEYPILGHR